MSFLHPILAGVGLACVAVPILIHILMRRRRAPVRWGAMKFLLAAYRRQRRRLQFEQWLLLAVRCLLVAAAALGIGGLLWGGGGETGGARPVVMFLVIDDSLASGAIDPTTGETSLERQIRAARGVAAQLNSARGDRLGILAASGPARPVLMPPTVDLPGAERVLSQMTPTDSAVDWAGAMRILGSVEASDGERRMAGLFSGWREGSLLDFSGVEAPGWLERVITSTPEETVIDNATLAAVEPMRSVVISSGVLGDEGGGLGGLDQVRVLVRRSGGWTDEPGRVDVRLSVQRGTQRVALGEGTAIFSRGGIEAWAVINADLGALASGGGVLVAECGPDGLAGDDVSRRVIELQRSLRVGLISEGGVRLPRTVLEFAPADWLRLALGPEAASSGEREIETVLIDPSGVDRGRLVGLDAVIVAQPSRLASGAWGRLRAFSDSGGLVVVFPEAGERVQRWTDDALAAFGARWRIERETHDLEGAIMREVERGAGLFSAIAGELAELARPVRVERVLGIDAESGVALRLEDGSPLVAVWRPGEDRRGLLVLFSVAMDLSWTTLPTKPFVIPLVQETIRQGVGLARGEWSEVAGSRPAAPPGAVELRPHVGGGLTLRVGPDGRTEEPVRQAGAWRAVDGAGVMVGSVVVEPDRRASQMETASAERVRGVLGGLGVEVVMLDSSREGVVEREGSGQGAMLGLMPHREKWSLGLAMLTAALILAVVETLLARRVSHATVRREVAG
ncbi:MAG: BatA domain-containing protein [Phycisphaeraceae bacterium]|nr:BatA domain-containing protein [Phycisphaeraceae bacterium]